MAVITGVVKNVAGNLTNGFIEVRTKKERGTTGTFIDSRRHRIKVTNGALIDAPDILEGPVRITVNSSDQGGSGSGFDEFDAVIPDAATVDLWDLKEQTYTYEPPVVSQVQALVAEAQGLSSAQDSAIADKVESPTSETRTALNGIYATPDQIEPAVTAAIAADSTVVDAAVAAVDAQVEPVVATALNDRGVQAINLDDPTLLGATLDGGGRAPLVYRTDGSVEIGFARIAGAETTRDTVTENYLKATVVGGYITEDALGYDGRVPQWVLNAWASRMNILPTTPTRTIKVVGLAGQSNATTADVWAATREEADPRLLLWDVTTQQITTAAASSAFLGTYFGRTWLDRYSHHEILVVPCAVGATGFTSTSIDPAPAGYHLSAGGTWDRTLTSDTNNLYTRFISNMIAAKAAATALGTAETIGVLWSQGEEDSRYLTQSQYAAKLDDLISAARTALSLPDLPFVIGDLLAERALAPSTDIPVYWNEITAALADTPRRVLKTSFSPGPKDMFRYNNGRIHWSAAGQQVRGRQFVDALFRARINVATSEPQPPREMTIRRSGTEAIIEWKTPECRVTLFELQTSTDSGATWGNVSLANPLDTRKTVTVTAGTPLWARARTTNEVGTSDYSIEVHG